MRFRLACSVTPEPAMRPPLFSIRPGVLLVLGSGLNERDTMHWTLRQRSKSRRIYVNTDMWEITSHGKPDHAVSGSCRAFLDLLANAAGAPAAALSEGVAERQLSSPR